MTLVNTEDFYLNHILFPYKFKNSYLIKNFKLDLGSLFKKNNFLKSLFSIRNHEHFFSFKISINTTKNILLVDFSVKLKKSFKHF